LGLLDLTQSLSRRGNPWDNAVIENFFGLLKSEIHYNPRSPLQANKLQMILERYICFYNKERIQKKLGYRTPVQYRESIA
jgi:putative transposase